MTSPLKRIESHPHEAKRLMVLTNFSFSCSIWTKHIQKQAKLKNIKSELLPKVVDVLLKFYPRKAFVFV